MHDYSCVNHQDSVHCSPSHTAPTCMYPQESSAMTLTFWVGTEQFHHHGTPQLGPQAGSPWQERFKGLTLQPPRGLFSFPQLPKHTTACHQVCTKAQGRCENASEQQYNWSVLRAYFSAVCPFPLC